MSWYNPRSWTGATIETKDAELTLDALVERLDLARATAAGIAISPATALKSPSVFAIVNRLSKAVAGLPLRILQDKSTPGHRKIEPQPTNDVSVLFSTSPAPMMTPYEYWQLVMVRLLLRGIFYAPKIMRGGQVIGVDPVDPDNVRPEKVNGIMVYHVTQDGTEQRIPQSKMHVIRAFSVDGMDGTSPVQQCAEAIALEIAAQNFGSTVFNSGAIPNVVLRKEGRFKDKEAIKTLKESWNAAFGKGKRGTAVLEDGITIEQMQMNNEESQFLETRKFQRSVIAGAWNVPPHMIGDLERATFSNIEELSLDFLRHALRPYLTCIEQAIDRDFIGKDGMLDGLRAKFDVSELLRGDVKTRSEALRVQRENGVINANEWRAIEGMDAREDEGGDDYITPLNFRVEDEDGTEDEKSGTTVVAMRRIR